MNRIAKKVNIVAKETVKCAVSLAAGIGFGKMVAESVKSTAPANVAGAISGVVASCVVYDIVDYIDDSTTRKMERIN